MSGEEPEFSHLREYKRGPVFSQIWGNYTKERAAFDRAAEESYCGERAAINEERARKCAFVVSIWSESELSELTHSMNLWKSKESPIFKGEYQVDLDERDFNEKDVRLISELDMMYPIEMILNSSVIRIDNHYFIFNRNDVPELTAQHFDILSGLAEDGQLLNPVYVEIDEGGRLLLIDERDVICMRILYPGISSELAVVSHMYIYYKADEKTYEYVKCQTLKPKILSSRLFKHYVDEQADITRNSFQRAPRIDCGKVFATKSVKYDDELKTSIRPDICCDLYDAVLRELHLDGYETVEMDEDALVCINPMITKV